MTDGGGKRGKRLGEILLEMGAIDPLQLQAAVGHHQQWGMPLGKAMLEKKFCSEADVLRALSIQSGVPAIDLDQHPLDARLVFNLPVKSAERLRAVPLRLEGKRHEILVVATTPPIDLAKIDTLRSVSGKQKVVAQLASDSALERAIATLYYGKPREVPAPPPPPAAPAAPPTGEAEFALEETPAAAPQPPHHGGSSARPVVLLYGWREPAARALAGTLRTAGLDSRVVNEAEMDAAAAQAVILTSVLALQTLLPSGGRAPGMTIVCGMPHDVDALDARAIGARMYLRPPFTAEQLRNAVSKCLGRPLAAVAL